MSKKTELEINEHDYYIVFTDSEDNYIIGYGYEQKPAIIDFKYAFEQLSNEQDLVETIPDFKKIVDYISVSIMNHKKFVKYMIKQEENAQKAEKKQKKKK